MKCVQFILVVYRFFKNLDYVDPAKAAIWGWVKLSFCNDDNDVLMCFVTVVVNRYEGQSELITSCHAEKQITSFGMQA